MVLHSAESGGSDSSAGSDPSRPAPDHGSPRGLSVFGWNEDLAARFRPYLPTPDHVPARIVRVDRGSCVAVAAEGPLRAGYGDRVPAVGDWAAVRRAPGDPAEITDLLPRTSAIVRGGVGRDSRGGLSGDSRGHVLAANVDVVYIVEPAAIEPRSAEHPIAGGPGPSLGRIERLLAIAWESGARPVVLITKSDLVPEVHALLREVAAVAPGAQVHAVSAHTGAGLAEVVPVPGETVVLLGPSGAGKSTLLNALAETGLMRTQHVRASDGRGRHTTTHRELFALPGGALVIDTPGLRRIGLYDSDTGLAQAFADIEELAVECRFSDCAHGVEPGCAVLAAVETGELPRRRLESWRKLRREAAWIARRGDARLRAEEARKWKIIHKEMRRSGRDRP